MFPFLPIGLPLKSQSRWARAIACTRTGASRTGFVTSERQTFSSERGGGAGNKKKRKRKSTKHQPRNNKSIKQTSEKLAKLVFFTSSKIAINIKHVLGKSSYTCITYYGTFLPLPQLFQHFWDLHEFFIWAPKGDERDIFKRLTRDKRESVRLYKASQRCARAVIAPHAGKSAQPPPTPLVSTPAGGIPKPRNKKKKTYNKNVLENYSDKNPNPLRTLSLIHI